MVIAQVCLRLATINGVQLKKNGSKNESEDYVKILMSFLTSVFLHLFQNQSQALFKLFQHLTAVANYIFIYNTYCIYSILIISLLYHIKSNVFVLKF